MMVDARATELAWDDAYEDAYPQVYRGLVAMGATTEEAQDALHDGFLAALGRAAVPTSFNNFRGWLFIVAGRKWRRRQWRERMASRVGLIPTSRTDPHDRIALYEEVAKLPRRERQVIVARFVLDLSQEETAALLGISRGTVGAATTHAAAKLRKRLGEAS